MSILEKSTFSTNPLAIIFLFDKFANLPCGLKKWFRQQVGEYGFIEGQDFVGVRHNVEGNKIQDFALIAQKRPTAQGNQTSFTDHAMKNELINVREENGKQLVSCKELYDGLGLNRSE